MDALFRLTLHQLTEAFADRQGRIQGYIHRLAVWRDADGGGGPDGLTFNLVFGHTLVEIEGNAKLAVTDPATGNLKDVKRIEFNDGSVWDDVVIN